MAAYIFDGDPSKGTPVSPTNSEAATIAERAAVGANFTYSSSQVGTLRKFRPENIEYRAAKFAKPDNIIISQQPSAKTEKQKAKAVMGQINFKTSHVRDGSLKRPTTAPTYGDTAVSVT